MKPETLADEFGPSEYTVDRSGWPAGPWDGEPDEVRWIDSDSGLACHMERNFHGAWCGYVGVTQEHRFYGVVETEAGVVAHGGLSYSDLYMPGGKRAEEGLWWFGFHCGHGYDFQPMMGALMKLYKRPARAYKDVAFVKEECRKLAGQLR